MLILYQIYKSCQVFLLTNKRKWHDFKIYDANFATLIAKSVLPSILKLPVKKA